MGQGTGDQESEPTIWIIGNTVLMEAVAACLEEKLFTNLVHWEMFSTDFESNLHTEKPNLIIFELDSPGSYMLLDLLKEQPGVQLLGLDQGSNQVIVLNSFQRTTRTMADLFQIVQEIAGGGFL